MRRITWAISLAALTLLAKAADKPAAIGNLTVAQLQQVLADAANKTDADVAEQLITLQLGERLSNDRLTQLESGLPGEKSRQALLLLADQSAFLAPPDADIPAASVPAPAETRQMLVQVVNYVNTTLRQLPNFIATRRTLAFQDRPKEDVLEANATVSYSYLPLHYVGESTTAVTYRDHQEVIEDGLKRVSAKGQVGGLVTAGEFGPILTTVAADALKGSITWARWERGVGGRQAVFHYAVPDTKSHYRVRFCCVVNGYAADGQPDMQIFDEKTPYHGEIAFNPSDGSILRLTVEAEMPAEGIVPRAGIVVEYGPIEIGGKNYICPTRSISILLAHINRPQGMYSGASYKGPAKTFVNNADFTNYRRFGSETRILTDTAQPMQ